MGYFEIPSHPDEAALEPLQALICITHKFSRLKMSLNLNFEYFSSSRAIVITRFLPDVKFSENSVSR